MRRFIPRWRKMTWALLIWVALIVIWIAVGTEASAAERCDTPEERGSLSQAACEAAVGVGTGLGVAFIIFLGIVGFFVLGLIWLMSRPRHRQCLRCGHDVKKGWTACKNCGYDFVSATTPSEQLT